MRWNHAVPVFSIQVLGQAKPAREGCLWRQTVGAESFRHPGDSLAELFASQLSQRRRVEHGCRWCARSGRVGLFESTEVQLAGQTVRVVGIENDLLVFEDHVKAIGLRRDRHLADRPVGHIPMSGRENEPLVGDVDFDAEWKPGLTGHVEPCVERRHVPPSVAQPASHVLL